MGIFILFLIFVYIGVSIALGLFFYDLPKTMGYPKVEKYLGIVYVIALLFLVAKNL